MFVLFVQLVVGKEVSLWQKMKLLYKEETYKIQGAIYEVNKEIGSGFLEALALTQIDPPSAHEVDPPLFMLRIIDPGRQYSQANNEQ